MFINIILILIVFFIIYIVFKYEKTLFKNKKPVKKGGKKHNPVKKGGEKKKPVKKTVRKRVKKKMFKNIGGNENTEKNINQNSKELKSKFEIQVDKDNEEYYKQLFDNINLNQEYLYEPYDKNKYDNYENLQNL